MNLNTFLLTHHTVDKMDHKTLHASRIKEFVIKIVW